jgi:hypothetical protein
MSTGIIGNSFLQDGEAALNRSMRGLYRSQYVSEIKNSEICNCIALLSLQKNLHIYRQDNTIVAFDGHLIGLQKKGVELLKHLINLFFSDGPDFPKKLRGSFQIAIIENFSTIDQVVYLYVDHTASRPIFYSIVENGLVFGPQISSIQGHLSAKEIDWPSVVQFLIGGYYFAGSTFLQEIKVLGPGKYLVVNHNKAQERIYFNYVLNNLNPLFSLDETIDKLSYKVRESIIESWYAAEEPAILLSGGLDSRYIFMTIAEAVSDTTKLKTVTWGENLSAERSDGQIASLIARKFGTFHIEMEKNVHNILKEFEEMFAAQSGMTDSAFYHANELTICKRLRENHGIQSLFRGDHCLGFKKKTHNYKNAMAVIGMGTLDQAKAVKRCFNEKSLLISRLFEERLTIELLKYGDVSPNMLKETLFLYQRLAMWLNPNNFFKYFFQDVYNPLSDPEILFIMMDVPDRYRDRKRLFYECYRTNFSKKIDIPFSEKTNLVDWGGEICRNQVIKKGVRDQIDNLPESFDKAYLRELVNKLEEGKTNSESGLYKMIKDIIKKKLPSGYVDMIRDLNEKRPHSIPINTPMLVIRLVVLSKWFQTIEK